MNKNSSPAAGKLVAPNDLFGMLTCMITKPKEHRSGNRAMRPILHTVTGRNPWCGPTALSSVLGITTDHAAAVLRGITGKFWVRGVFQIHLYQALVHLGCEVEVELFGDHLGKPRPTMNEWSIEQFSAQSQTPRIVNYAGHYGAVLQNNYQCRLTDCRSVALDDLRFADDSYVDSVMTIRRLPSTGRLAELIATYDSQRHSLRQAHRLARTHGINILPTMNGWIGVCQKSDLSAIPAPATFCDWVQVESWCEHLTSSLR